MDNQSLTPPPDQPLKTEDLDALYQNRQLAGALAALEANELQLKQRLDDLDIVIDKLSARRAELCIEVEFEREQNETRAEMQRQAAVNLLRLRSESLHLMQSDVEAVFLEEIKDTHDRILRENNSMYMEAYQATLADMKGQYERERNALGERIAVLERHNSTKRKCSRCSQAEAELADLRKELQGAVDRGRELNDKLKSAISNIE